MTAHLTMDNIRRLIESNIATDDGKPVTISAGVSEADLSDPAGLNRAQQVLIQKADENLYRAKSSGRNRVCSLSENSCQMRIAFPEYPAMFEVNLSLWVKFGRGKSQVFAGGFLGLPLLFWAYIEWWKKKEE